MFKEAEDIIRDSVGCEKNGGANAICTEYTGSEAGLSTDSDADFRWVFEITFKNVRQQDLLLDSSIRSGYVNSLGGFAAPLVTCAPGDESSCYAFTDGLATQSLPDSAEVPVPGVPALLLIGMAGLCFARRR